jgi:energy-converting hydrogenase B subunit D
MSIGAWAFDGLLGLALVVTAWRLTRTPGLLRSILLFFAFGLLMALAWVRLDAVDVALAEVTIGAGVTGALFLAAHARLRRPLPRDAGPLGRGDGRHCPFPAEPPRSEETG